MAIKVRDAEERPCPRCGGCGRVQSPRWLVPNDGDFPAYLKGVPENTIPAVVLGSASIFEACNAARIIADDNNRPVSFSFNEQTVTVHPGEDAEKVGRAWWKVAYDETPEESAARR